MLRGRKRSRKEDAEVVGVDQALKKKKRMGRNEITFIERTNCLTFMCVLECVWSCVTDAYNRSLHQYVCVAFACMYASRDDLLRDVVAARDLTTGLVRFVELQLKYLHSLNRRDFGLSTVTQ